MITRWRTLPLSSFRLRPHTRDQFVLPTGIHIFLIPGTTCSAPDNLRPTVQQTRPRQTRLSSCLCPASSGERRPAPRRSSGGVPSRGGEETLKRGQEEEKNSSLIAADGGGGSTPVSTLVRWKTGGLPGGRRRDQYYTRVELDLKSTLAEAGPEIPGTFTLSTEWSNKRVKRERREQLSLQFFSSSSVSPSTPSLSALPTPRICFAFKESLEQKWNAQLADIQKKWDEHACVSIPTAHARTHARFSADPFV